MIFRFSETVRVIVVMHRVYKNARNYLLASAKFY